MYRNNFQLKTYDITENYSDFFSQKIPIDLLSGFRYY